jgi:hypothetical protein
VEAKISNMVRGSNSIIGEVEEHGEKDVRGSFIIGVGPYIVYKFSFVRLNAKASSDKPVFTLGIGIL